MIKEWISLIVFVAGYAMFVIFPHRRSWVACGGGLLLVLCGILGWKEALMEKINWNVMGLFFGTIMLAELFMLSRVPAVMAEWLVDRARTGRGAMLTLCLLAGFISIFVENVAVVLLVAPVALSLSEKLKMNPVPLLIGIAISSNLQGTATMIGDPPSMILAGYMRMGFFDFFFYHHKPGIFFAVEVGCIASLLVLALVFRRHHEPIKMLPVEKARSWFPASMLGVLIIGLSISTLIDPEFAWFAGVFTMVLAAASTIWYLFSARWGKLGELAKSIDWDTTFFLIGVFVLVAGLSDSGWLDFLSTFFVKSVDGNVFIAFLLILFFSVIISGFVDNVPFLLAMIPVAQKTADGLHTPVPLLLFALLIGSCLGGNLTPIGASANVVTLGILKKRGHTVRFGEFMKISVPFTVAAVLAAGVFVWFVWAP